MKHHNMHFQPDLQLLSRGEVVGSEQKIIYESLSYILTNFDPNFEKSTFFKKTSMTKEQVQHIEIITRNQNNNSLWFKFRQRRITF